MNSSQRTAIAASLLLLAEHVIAVLPPPTEEEIAAENARIVALRESAPEHLRLKVTRVASEDDGDTTWVTADAVVLETYRSDLGLEPGDAVVFRYSGQWTAIERFWNELQAKAARGYVGPGIESMPQQPIRVGAEDVIEAWLSRSPAAPPGAEGVVLLPAAGVHSLATGTELNEPASAPDETTPP